MIPERSRKNIVLSFYLLNHAELLINFIGSSFNIFYINSKPSTLLSQSYF